MKKFIVLIGALLFAAVFMSGCVTETEDPVVGIWHADTVNAPPQVGISEIYCIFNADGTGYSLAGFTGEAAYGKLTFTWKNAGDGKYAVTYIDKSSEELVLADGALIMDRFGNAVKLHNEPLAEYVEGLWISERGNYDDQENLKNIVLFAADGTGYSLVFGEAVVGIEDVYAVSITWEEKDGKIFYTGEKGYQGTFVPDGGELVFAEVDGVLHKYTFEDHLFGLWMSDEPFVENGVTYDSVMHWKEDGTGVEMYTIPDSHKASEKYSFTWKKLSLSTFEVTYEDGEVLTFTEDRLKLSDGETSYSKVGMQTLSEYAAQVTA